MRSTLEIAKIERILQHNRCPECGNEEFVTDKESGEVICSKCGLVTREVMLDQRAEWRAFTPEERASKSRVGSPTTITKFDKGLSTTFQPYKDAYGRSLSMEDRLKMTRLRKWDFRARMHSSTQRNLSQAMNTLTQLSDKLHIPNHVKENAALIYRKALEKGLVRGRSILAIAAASLYAACRLSQIPRSLKAIVDVSNRKRKEISRCYRLLQRKLEIKMPADDPRVYISKVASKAGLSQKTQNLAMDLLEKAKKRRAIVGKAPMGIAAAALYIASVMNNEEKKVTQQNLANAAGVTEVTVRNRYKGLAKSLGMKDLLR